jgi:hypothetical protein
MIIQKTLAYTVQYTPDFLSMAIPMMDVKKALQGAWLVLIRAKETRN